jgi:hypothetical protein
MNKFSSIHSHNPRNNKLKQYSSKLMFALLTSSIFTTFDIGVLLANDLPVASAPNPLQDTDRNGVVDLKEVDDYFISVFSRLDKNRNGQLEKEEQMRPSSTEVKLLDKNKDSNISLSELMQAAHAHFKVADADNNKVLSIAELKKFETLGYNGF